MEPLYRLEHQILPELIFGEEKISPFMLGNHFSDICYDIINGFYDKEEFVAKPIVVKDNGKPAYYLVQFCFPFEVGMCSLDILIQNITSIWPLNRININPSFFCFSFINSNHS